jgi:copper resistance protein D
MNTFSLAVRPIHFIGVMVLFGAFVFLSWIARPAFRGMPDAQQKERHDLYHRLLQISGWSLVAIFASDMLWLAMEAIQMSGLGFERALTGETLSTVLNETQFGHIWKIRFGLALALAALLVAARGSSDDRGWRVLAPCGLLLAGALLATLAWTGHAAADRGIDHTIHLFADAAHLLAAGAWFGTLFALVFVLTFALRAPSPDSVRFAAYATRRFSALGIVSMAVLVAGGVTNSWYTVGSVDALFATHYGQLLLAKLTLFGAVLVLAAFNRLQLTPQLLIAADKAYGLAVPSALRGLWRNAIIELALGFAIVEIVGALGVTVPAIHMQHLHHPSEMVHRH